MVPDPLLLDSSTHTDEENVDVCRPDFLDHERFFRRVKVAGVKAGDMKTRIPSHDIGGSPLDNVRLCTEEVDTVSLPFGKCQQRAGELDTGNAVLDARSQHARSPHDANAISNDQIRLLDNLEEFGVLERTSGHLAIQCNDEMGHPAFHETVGYLEKLVNIPVADGNAKEVDVVDMFPR